jgi:hypothetical protein
MCAEMAYMRAIAPAVGTTSGCADSAIGTV